MANVLVTCRREFRCRCGISFLIRQSGKPDEIQMHQQLCNVAPGDTVQKDEFGWQPRGIYVVLDRSITSISPSSGAYRRPS